MKMMSSEMPRMMDNQPVIDTINQAPECVLLVDASGVVEVANAAALSLFYLDESELSGKHLSSWFSEEDAVRIDQAAERTLADAPGSQLEEVVVVFARPPLRKVKLSLAQMKHRDGLCVVVTSIDGNWGDRDNSSQSKPIMPKKSANNADSVQGRLPVSHGSLQRKGPTLLNEDGPARPYSAQIEQNMPWKNRKKRLQTQFSGRSAGASGQQSRSFQLETHAQRTEAWKYSVGQAEACRDAHEGDKIGDEQPSATVNDGVKNWTDQVQPEAKRSAVEKASPLSVNQITDGYHSRDIYAEFESERDRRERHRDVPDILPGQCLVSALDMVHTAAVSESVALVTSIDDCGQGVALDEELLTALFRHLVGRVIAVSPPYCDASISLQGNDSGGFMASFSDMGRGLNEAELDVVFNQPDLALGASRTGVVQAQAIASKLGMHFAIKTAIDKGTTIEVSWQG